MAVNSAV